MENLIFALPITGRAANSARLLARSIRTFGGMLANNPIWFFAPGSDNELSQPTRAEIAALKARLVAFEIAPEVRQFPLAVLPVAAAAAEIETEDQAEILAWLDCNTLVIQEPAALRLEEGTNLGYRPVHHTNIGSVYDAPIDSYWGTAYQLCRVPKERIFPMETHVQDNVLRPYFNAGLLAVRPRRGLLRAWRDNFLRVYHDPCFDPFYNTHFRYQIFIHQVVLSATILAVLERRELRELPPRYNYPLNLHPECPAAVRPGTMNDLITCRYEEYGDFGLEPGPNDTLQCEGDLREWLREQLRPYQEGK